MEIAEPRKPRSPLKIEEMCSLGEWVDFFVKAGIPSGEAASYALIFSRNRIQNNMLIDLNKEYLRDMGISPLGDIIAILKHAKTVHETASRARIMSEASEVPQPAPSATVNRLMDHFSLKLKEAKEEIISKKEKPEIDNAISERKNKESHVKLPKPCVKIGSTSISISDSDSDEEYGEAEIRVPYTEVVTKPANEPQHIISRKPQPKPTSEKRSSESPRPSAAKKLCVFSRLGNAGSTTPEVVTIKQETAHVKPSANGSRATISEKSERPIASLPSSELKMIKITTEFSDDDDIEMNLPEQAIAAKVAKVAAASTKAKASAPRKRLHSDDMQDTDKETPSLPTTKKVRFGGTSTRVIPDTPPKSPVFLGHTVVVKTPNPTVERFESRKIATSRPRDRNDGKLNVKIERPRPEMVQIAQINTRIGVAVVRPTPAKPMSKMVADRIMTKGDQAKKSVKSRIDLKNTILSKADQPKQSVKSRIDLTNINMTKGEQPKKSIKNRIDFKGKGGKMSVLERLG